MTSRFPLRASSASSGEGTSTLDEQSRDRPPRPQRACRRANAGGKGHAGLQLVVERLKGQWLRGLGIESVWLGRLPQRQQLAAEEEDVRVRHVLLYDVEGVGTPSATRLRPKCVAVLQSASSFLFAPLGSLHKCVAHAAPAVAKRKSMDDPVAIKQMTVRVSSSFQPTGPIAKERAVEVCRDFTLHIRDFVRLFLEMICVGRSPVGLARALWSEVGCELVRWQIRASMPGPLLIPTPLDAEMAAHTGCLQHGERPGLACEWPRQAAAKPR